MTNLDRAKELREAKEILILRAQKIMKDNFSNGWDCDESFFKHKSYAKTIEDINKTAKQLKEKVEKGCGDIIKVYYGLDDGLICGKDEVGKYEDNEWVWLGYNWLCKECTETLKILEGILE